MAHKLEGRETWAGIEPSASSLDRVASVRKQLPSDELFAEATETFAALADATRAKIICSLSITDLNVSELADVVGMSHSAVSHQLRTLRLLRVVRSRQEGSAMYYSLVDSHLKAMFEEAVYHADHATHPYEETTAIPEAASSAGAAGALTQEQG